MFGWFEDDVLRSKDAKPQVFFSHKSIEDLVPKDYPIRALKNLLDEALEKLPSDFDQLYSHAARPSILPDQLLRTLLIQISSL